MTMLDIESIEHLDFAFQPPCEAADPWDEEAQEPMGCGNAAVFAVHFTCCKPMRLYCEECLNERLTWPDGLHCGICDTEYMPSSTAYTSIDRI